MPSPFSHSYPSPSQHRFTQINADAGIARMYHSEALLMPDGNVLLAGSNPNALATSDGPYPTIYQTQLFHPPYATWGVQRNKLAKVRTVAT